VTKEGLFPNIAYTRVPGREIIGIVDAVGAGVAGWSHGQRVGIAWHGGSCGYYDACRGDAFACETETLVTRVTSDGGYADYTIAPATALARVSDDLGTVEAAPLMCVR
jgi:D-arabinose 1-dehydrogenase-like Zn-dependent alcohol dehydrogenase